jgi:hypothetical protein
MLAHILEMASVSFWTVHGLLSSQLCQYPDYTALMIWWLMNTKQLVERELAGETELLGENLSPVSLGTSTET